jgi:hypothetical protein
VSGEKEEEEATASLLPVASDKGGEEPGEALGAGRAKVWTGGWRCRAEPDPP